MSDDLKRFLAKVIEVQSGCHEWQSTLHRDGYGKFWFARKQVQAHRVAYELQVGKIPAGKHVLHKCDNRRCVNPQHLYIGDAKQNVKDMHERCKWYGRMKTQFADVQRIRELYVTGRYTQQQLAGQFGCGQTQISRYVRHEHRALK